jgi:LPPG:FO 2-phospho-L-lactate transferase
MALNVVALAGGVGGAKLAYGLSRVLPGEQLTIIVNTADDFCLYGLAISPDLDTVMYTLAGVANPETGWGIAGDTTQMLDMLARYGELPWFRLGDRDLATHLLRTFWLAEGQTLTRVTRRLCDGLSILHRILPMTDSSVRTMVTTKELGTLAFQEYFVQHRWQPTVESLDYMGAERAQLSDEVKRAMALADVVVVCPSNPWLSVAPILEVPGFKALLGQKTCIAVSPIVGGKAIKGPAAKLMAELGWPVSPKSVADYYGDLLAGFVLDERDAAAFTEGDSSCRVLTTDIIMRDDRDKIRLAREILEWIEGWGL